MTIVVDPYLLAIPSGDNVTADSIRSYVGRLIGWDRAFRNNVDYVVSSAVMSQIYRLNLCPDNHNLESLFEKYHIEEHSAQDIAESCKTVIENYPQMESKAFADDVECVKENQRIIPEEIKVRLHPDIAEAFSEALISTSYALNLLSDSDEWTLATAPTEENYTEIIASGLVRETRKTILVERQWHLLFKPSEYIDLIAQQERTLKVYETNPLEALSISWTKVKNQVAHIADLSDFNIQFKKEFVESIKDKVIRQRPNYKKDLERIFDGIVYAVTNLWKYPGDKHHPLREKVPDRTSDQQTRKRGECTDYAGRIEIFGGKTPLHVHYWRCEDGTYEISNVTNDHHDPTIYK